MRRHPVPANELLAPIDFLRPTLSIPLCHHKKWDSTSYPSGLKGETIPFLARMFAIADVWDALLSERPYRLAWPLERVSGHLYDLSGTHFDPSIVEAYLALVHKNDAPNKPETLTLAA